MNRNFDTQLLRTFLTINDQGGFIKAGKILGRSQSAISMQMKRLEEIADISLFKKDGRKTRLTPSGEILLGYARQIITLNDQAFDTLQQGRIAGKVNLAVMGDYAANVLPTIIADFITQYPEISIDVATGFSYDLIRDLGSKYELVLSTQPVGSGGGEILKREATRWAFASDLAIPDSEVLPLAMLPPGNFFRDWALEALNKAGIRWRIAFMSTSIAAVEGAAQAGIAIAVVKEGSARPGLRFINTIEGLPELPASDIVLHKDPGGLSRPAQLFSDFLKSALR